MLSSLSAKRCRYPGGSATDAEAAPVATVLGAIGERQTPA